MPPRLTEKQWEEQVSYFAQLCGWSGYHTRDSRRSAPGFPDWVFVRAPELLFVELKSDSGKLNADQERWIEDLRLVELATDGIVRVRVWRPADWADAERILARRG